MYGYIYKTTNLITNKIYIGQHKSEFFDTRYFGSGVLITQAINLHGLENFTCEMIDTADSFDELNLKECYWIKKLDSRNPNIGYNMTSGGDCCGLLFCSEDTMNKFKKRRRDVCKSSRWWNDSVHEKFSTECPGDGWSLGRCPTSVKQLQQQCVTVTNKLWINNGQEERYVDSISDIPPNWYQGRLKGRPVTRVTPAWNKGIPNTRLKGTVWVCTETSRKQVPKDELEYWLSQGWHKGHTFITNINLPAGKDVNDLSAEEVHNLIPL